MELDEPRALAVERASRSACAAAAPADRARPRPRGTAARIVAVARERGSASSAASTSASGAAPRRARARSRSTCGTSTRAQLARSGRPSKSIDDDLVPVVRLVERERDRRAGIADRTRARRAARDACGRARRSRCRRGTAAATPTPGRRSTRAARSGSDGIRARHVQMPGHDQRLVRRAAARAPPRSPRRRPPPADPRHRAGTSIGRRNGTAATSPAPPATGISMRSRSSAPSSSRGSAADHVHAELAQHRRRRAEPRRRVVVARDRDDVHRRPRAPRRGEELEPHPLRARRRRRAVEHVARDHQRRRAPRARRSRAATPGTRRARARASTSLSVCPRCQSDVWSSLTERARSHGGLIRFPACIDSRAFVWSWRPAAAVRAPARRPCRGRRPPTKSVTASSFDGADGSGAMVLGWQLDFFEDGPGADCTDGSLKVSATIGIYTTMTSDHGMAAALPAPGGITIVTMSPPTVQRSGRREHERRRRRRDRRQPRHRHEFHLDADAARRPASTARSPPAAPTAPARRHHRPARSRAPVCVE